MDRFRIEQRRQRHLEDAGYFARQGPHDRWRFQMSHKGMKDDIGGGNVDRGERPQKYHRLGIDTDFLLRLAKGRAFERFTGGLHAARKSDLPGMSGQVRTSLGEHEHGLLRRIRKEEDEGSRLAGIWTGASTPQRVSGQGAR